MLFILTITWRDSAVCLKLSGFISSFCTCNDEHSAPRVFFKLSSSWRPNRFTEASTPNVSACMWTSWSQRVSRSSFRSSLHAWQLQGKTLGDWLKKKKERKRNDHYVAVLNRSQQVQFTWKTMSNTLLLWCNETCTHYPSNTYLSSDLYCLTLRMCIFFLTLLLHQSLPLFPLRLWVPPVPSRSPRVLLRFGEISAGNCESFTSCSHNGLWDYAKHSA